ncbi:P-loop containing nucleoside triphosphate hydrolase protein [Boletus edulis BED1]|uniref:P-loop containing nucleoside triphosphate hydrolase protein n=1 Tax=Boletus edulis BED1 TaxID=1328754 RepID=A0AAD4C770_BOLED|nr:P-loop containing nucleoside triphosphate hydrolase protein [Boletus edulis BED1]
MTQALQQDIEYVDVRSSPDRHEPTNFYEKWLDQSSAKHAIPELIAADALRKFYPGYSLVVSDDFRLNNLLSLPGITIHPQEPGLERVLNVQFIPTAARIEGRVTGSLVDNTIVGSYKLTWNNSDFIVHITHFQNGFSMKTVHFILYDGPEQPARDFVLAACLYTEQIHDEIWVFNRGFWNKDKTLWLGIKDSSWDDVVMKEESKMALQKDVYGFFKSEMTYKKLSIPWKRGLIMYGPPGNGKTISIKVIMKTCMERGFIPLYVKSFQSPQGEEVSMENVFRKTRQLAPCVLILEDLDSLINDRNRSFFLNQLDGLEGNDGLLVIGSTNHFDRLDPGLSNRPSRFDRKYLVLVCSDDPNYEERVLYAKYWQKKLEDNDEISFPDSLVEEVAGLTQGFSFAYLKEAFMSTLVRITNADDDERVEFSVMLKSQIMTLRKELGEQTLTAFGSHPCITQPEKELDGRVSHEKQRSTTSQEDMSSQRSRGPTQPSLKPMYVSPPGTWEEPFLSPMAQAVRKRPTDGSKSRAIERISGPGSTVHSSTPFLQGCVLHAPPSAYPQVMPGSLPSMRPVQERSSIAARRGAPARSSSISGVDSSRRNPFSLDNAPLIEIDGVLGEPSSSVSTDRNVWI